MYDIQSKDHKLCFENSIKIKHLMCLSMTPNLIFIQTKQILKRKNGYKFDQCHHAYGERAA